MSERQNDYCCTGWTPTEKVKLPTKAQLIAMRDYWLERGHQGTAAAIDNAIELIEKSTAQEMADKFTDVSEPSQVEIDAQLDRITGEYPKNPSEMYQDGWVCNSRRAEIKVAYEKKLHADYNKLFE